MMTRSHFVALAAFCGICSARAEMFTAPEYFGPVDAAHAASSRVMITCPSLAVAPNGRLWATWFTGPTPGEDYNNYTVLATSMDEGKTWEEVCLCDPDGQGPRRTFDPQVWISPDGKLRWTWTDRTITNRKWSRGNEQTDGLWMAVVEDACAPFRLPAPPVCIGHGVMLGNPVVLSDGTWCLPTCVWFSEKSSGMTVSTDGGRTFQWRGGASIPDADDRKFDEHNIIERKNGDLLCLSRCLSGLREAISKDKGFTWSPLLPSRVRHTCSRTALMRLKSGNLLLVKHGPIDKNVGRTHLTAYVSKDDGETWEGGLLLDERGGAAYPNGQERPDGVIYMVYDHDRYGEQNVLFATFTEADVLAGKDVSGKVRLRQTINHKSESSAQTVKTTELPETIRLPADSGWSGHLQGAATDGEFVFWSWTKAIVKSDIEGKVVAEAVVPFHHGDLCVRDGVVYVAVNLGKFNDPSGTAAKSWVYAYDAKTLEFRNKWQVPELIWGAGGMTYYQGRFYVVGGLPNGVEGNALYEYTPEFRFLQKIPLAIGWTSLGIQTVDATEDGWFRFGIYGQGNLGGKSYSLMCRFGAFADSGAFVRINVSNPAIATLRLNGCDYCGGHWRVKDGKGLWTGQIRRVEKFRLAEGASQR